MAYGMVRKGQNNLENLGGVEYGNCVESLSQFTEGKMMFVLTGAGISRESGLATFRDKDGLWTKVRIEDVATPAAFRKNPELVYEFYNQRRRELTSGKIKPNRAHLALAKLEAALSSEKDTAKNSGNQLFLVTQNIDNLHELAGSHQVCHMHGQLCAVKCNSCGSHSDWTDDLGSQDICPKCQAIGFLRPDVVWFHEVPYHLDEIQDKLSKCETFVSIGTSGTVYPAASFLNLAKGQGAETIEINLEPSAAASNFDRTYYGPATKVVTAWVNDVLSQRGLSLLKDF
jgi:NAD-dependent deacetylase